MKLHWQILIAILLAVVAGSITTPETVLLGVQPVAVYQFLGTLFLNALKMISLPLVVCAIISALGNLAGHHALGRLGGKAAGYYLATSAVAVSVGVLVANLIAPGVGAPPGLLALGEGGGSEVAALAGAHGLGDISQVFHQMVPPNLAKAWVEGNLLGWIFFAILYGFFIGHLPEQLARTQKEFWSGAFQTILALTGWLLRFAPLGVFGLIANTVVQTGFDAVRPMAWFFLTVVLGLALHALVVLPLALRLLAGVSPLRHARAMWPAILTAFSSASSSATLPVTMQCLQRGAGVSQQTSSFVLPIGASVNMDGTALYECVAALFIMQLFGVELSLATQFMVLFLALVTSIGVAGIPAASLVAIGIILTAVGLPLEALGLLLITDRLLDMLRTTVNVWSDSCGVVIIARSEGEKNVLGKDPE